MWVQEIHFIQHTNQKTLISKICFKLEFFLVSVMNKVDSLYPHVLFLVYFMVEHTW